MIVEQKMTAAVKNEVKKQLPLRGLFLLSCFWLAIFIAALTLIINLFQPQWQKIGSNVQSLVNNDWQTMANTDALQTKNEENRALISQEATKSALETIDIDFIEGLVKAILTASESARTATASAHF